jgi:hypothetical protein
MSPGGEMDPQLIADRLREARDRQKMYAEAETAKALAAVKRAMKHYEAAACPNWADQMRVVAHILGAESVPPKDRA